MPPRKPPGTPVLLDVLESLPAGQRLWVRGVGSSLLRRGDSVRVLRCGPEALSRGDVALVRQGRQLVTRVVVSTRPWKTAALLGGVDALDGVVLGRVVAVRRGRWVLPLSRPFRPALWLAQQVLSAAWARPRARVGYRRVRDFFFSSWSRPLRRRLVGPLEVRLLKEDDLDALLVFAGERLVVSPPFLRRQLRDRWGLPDGARRGAAAGAFDAQGLLHGFVWADSYRQEGLPLNGVWVRSLVVAPQARRMRVATRLVECLMAEVLRQGETSLHADVDEDNEASLRTFGGLGFQKSSPELTQLTNQAWDAAGRTKVLVVLERELGG